MQSRRDIYHHKIRIKPKIIVTSIILLIVILIIVIFQIALNPIKGAQKTYENIAKENGITSPSNFLVSNRSKVYYSVFGKNKSNKNVAIIMQENNKKFKPVILKIKDGISYDQIKAIIEQNYGAHKIYSSGLTMYQGVPAWDVSYLDNNNKLSFAVIQFSNGKQLKLIKNL